MSVDTGDCMIGRPVRGGRRRPASGAVGASGQKNVIPGAHRRDMIAPAPETAFVFMFFMSAVLGSRIPDVRLPWESEE